MKPQLRDLQKTFKSHLMSGDHSIAEHIVSTQDLSKEIRLAIYGNAYYARLAEALQQDYEAIHGLLGDDEFNLLCTRYIDKNPSQFFSLRWYGQSMSEFLAHTMPYSDYPYLKEMAEFEWSFIEAFDAQDTSIASIDDVVHITPEHWPELCIELHPSVRLFEYNWNILPVWRALTSGEAPPVLIRLEQAQYCMVWRQTLMTKYRTIDRDEGEFINGVLAGENFSQLCERLVQCGIDPEQVPMQAASILKTWLEQGVFARLITG